MKSKEIKYFGYIYRNPICHKKNNLIYILNEMERLCRKFGYVSVADMYDLFGLNCTYTDNLYGWTSLKDAKVKRIGFRSWHLYLPGIRRVREKVRKEFIVYGDES